MTALAKNRDTKELGLGLSPLVLVLPVTATKHIYAGSFVAMSAAGTFEPASTLTTLKAIGRATKEVDNSLSLSPAPTCEVETGIFLWGNSAAADAIANDDIGKSCYLVDDQTVALTDGTGTRSFAGKICGLVGSQVAVATSPILAP